MATEFYYGEYVPQAFDRAKDLMDKYNLTGFSEVEVSEFKSVFNLNRLCGDQYIKDLDIKFSSAFTVRNSYTN